MNTRRKAALGVTLRHFMHEDARQYECWCNDLITMAIRDFNYAVDVITPLVEEHVFSEYYADEYTPLQALNDHESNE